MSEKEVAADPKTKLERNLHYYALKQQAEDFLFDEADLLDERRFVECSSMACSTSPSGSISSPSRFIRSPYKDTSRLAVRRPAA